MSDQKKKKIFVLEDDLVNQKIMGRLITHFGYDLVMTDDGFAAIDIIKRERPDLLLLDVQLVGITGIEVASAVRQTKGISTIPIVMVTALATSDDRDRIIKESQCNDYMSKPFTPNELSEKIQKYI